MMYNNDLMDGLTMDGSTTCGSEMTTTTEEPMQTARRPQRVSFEAKLFAVSTALRNTAENEEICARLAAYGCDAEHLAEGQARYDAAFAADQQVPLAQGQRRQAISTFYNQWAQAKRIYSDHLDTARRVFRNRPEAQSSLKLLGPRASRFSAWLNQAEQFYDTLQASDAYTATLTQVGLSAEQLTLGRQRVAATRQARMAYERAVGAEQIVRAQRTKAIDAMMRWFTTFRTIARGAFREMPQLMRKLNLPVPSS